MSLRGLSKGPRHAHKRGSKKPCFLEKGRVAKRVRQRSHLTVVIEHSQRGRWGEEEPPHEVKAYQPDMLTEYGARRRRGNPTKRKTVASVGTTIVSSAWQSLSLLSIVFDTDTPVILGRAMLVPTATFLFLSGSEE